MYICFLLTYIDVCMINQTNKPDRKHIYHATTTKRTYQKQSNKNLWVSQLLGPLTMLTQTNGSSNEAINDKNIKQAYQIIKHKSICLHV